MVMNFRCYVTENAPKIMIATGIVFASRSFDADHLFQSNA
jgi:hypothetical protein